MRDHICKNMVFDNSDYKFREMEFHELSTFSIVVSTVSKYYNAYLARQDIRYCTGFAWRLRLDGSIERSSRCSVGSFWVTLRLDGSVEGSSRCSIGSFRVTLHQQLCSITLLCYVHGRKHTYTQHNTEPFNNCLDIYMIFQD